MSSSTPRPGGRDAVAGLVAAVAGLVAAAAALATGELAGALLPGAASPVAAVGATAIDLAPPGSKELVVALFGPANKLALELTVVGAVLLAGLKIGRVARGSLAEGTLAIGALAGLGALAALRVGGGELLTLLLVAALQLAVGLQVLVLLGLGEERPAPDAGTGAAHASPATPAGSSAGLLARRSFLVRAGAIGILSAVGGWAGRLLAEGRVAGLAGGAGGSRPPLPAIVDPAPAIPAGAELAIDGITPLVTPPDRFYRIDTALVTPAVDLAGWRLRIHGLVEREAALTFEELVELPLVERHVTIACVSNEVGGDLVGTARWTGVRLTDLLELAGARAGATQIVGRSVDGWTAGFPTAWVTDPGRPRDALVAVGMNGIPLPARHGYPARLVVPGLYGYVSATKWLTELELTTMEAYDAYWIPRGWAKEAPILTQSRIDVPRDGAALGAGPVELAGVAWAPDRGITRVEVSVDGGPWLEAELAEAIGPQTWVQWRRRWDATPGDHVVRVRATDGTGTPQTDRVTPPVPDGARGHHGIRVTVA